MFRCRMTSSLGPRGSSSVKAGERGATLAELLVVLVILSILAVVAIPFAETTVQRQNEQALRSALRDVRTALDRFNDDLRAGVFGDTSDGISENGFPDDLQVLVDGLADDEGATRRYLRRLPTNPFAKNAELEDQWLFLGYTDPPDASVWNGEDIYDLRAVTERTAIDGTALADW